MFSTKLKICALAGTMLTGCATVPPIQVAINTTFTQGDVAWFSEKGNNTLQGSALLRTKGGTAKTCAANEVNLIPYSEYTAERMDYIYGNSKKGYGSAGPRRSFEFVPDVAEYHDIGKHTNCDAQGKFEFTELPDGDYYIIAPVMWSVGTVYSEGGNLMEKVSLANGETQKIVMTR